jgi:hypothetical protein
VVDGIVIDHADTSYIVNCENFHVVSGRANGSVYIYPSGLWVPLINGDPVRLLDDQPVTNCSCVRNIGGKLNGAVTLRRLLPDTQTYAELTVPVIGGEVIYAVEGRAILECADIHNVGGLLNGRVDVGVGNLMPVVAGKVVWEIDGTPVLGGIRVNNIGGRLNGLVEVEIDGKAELRQVVAGALVQPPGENRSPEPIERYKTVVLKVTERRIIGVPDAEVELRFYIGRASGLTLDKPTPSAQGLRPVNFFGRPALQYGDSENWSYALVWISEQRLWYGVSSDWHFEGTREGRDQKLDGPFGLTTDLPPIIFNIMNRNM